VKNQKGSLSTLQIEEKEKARKSHEVGLGFDYDMLKRC